MSWRHGTYRTFCGREKLLDVVGLYVDQPACAIVLSVDEKRPTQALDVTQSGVLSTKVAPAQ